MATNLVSELDEAARDYLAARVLNWVRRDLEGRTDWMNTIAESHRLWACEPPKRQLPWPKASNICVPVVASAVNNWTGMTLGAMFENPYPERVQVVPTEPNDVKRADRTQKYLNWQLIFEMGGEYEQSYDHLLPALAIEGVAWKKIWYCEKHGRVRTAFVSAQDVIVPEDTTTSADARRITHRLRQHPEQIEQAGIDGFYDADAAEAATTFGDEHVENKVIAEDKTRLGIKPIDNEAEENAVYECAFWGWLPDGTDERDEKRGYKHWIAWVDNATGHLLRLVEHPKEIDSFLVDYHLIPSPSGGFYSYGLGHFLRPLNLLFNAIFNQYTDAGALTNQPFTVVGRGAGLRGKTIELKPGGTTYVDDATQVIFSKFPGLDQNLPLIMGFLKEFGQDISANTDEVQGRVQRGVREPTVRGQMARVGQAMARSQVFARRVFLSQRRELETIMALDAMHVGKKKQFKVLGSTEMAPFAEISADDLARKYHLMPTSNPEFASIERKRGEAAELMNVAAQHAMIGLPSPTTGQVPDPATYMRITRDYFMTMGKADLARYLPEPPPLSIDPYAENQLFVEGETEEPKTGEDHARHARVHSYLLDGTIPNVPEDAKDRTRRHIRDHLLQAQAEQMIAQQQQMAAQAAGQAAPPAEATNGSGAPLAA